MIVLNILDKTCIKTESVNQKVHVAIFAKSFQEMPVSLESTYLVKFSLSKKPWEAAFKQKYLPNFSSEFRKMIKVWLKEAENVCGFSDPDDWIEKTEQDQDTNDLYFYENHQIGPPRKLSTYCALKLFRTV